MSPKSALSASLSASKSAIFGPVLVLGLLFFLLPTANGKPRNPYKLPLVTNKKHYRKQLKAQPETGLVELKPFLKPFPFSMAYTSDTNFTRQVLYPVNAAFYLRKPAAEKLKQVQDSLQKAGLNVFLFDAYRPYAVTLKMWDAVPDDRYAANPANGSGHNRGIAIDLTLAELETGKPLPMPTGFDNFSDTAHYSFTQLPETVLANRQLLRGVMEHFGFVALETEWWHFYLPEPKQYPLMDLPFGKLRKWQQKKNGWIGQ